MDELRVRLLGMPAVTLNDTPITEFSTSKSEALLYYLVVTGRPHSREQLAGLLWRDMPDANARRNLTKALSDLRKLVEPFLLIERQHVAFDRETPYWLDVAEIRESPDFLTASMRNVPERHRSVRAVFEQSWQMLSEHEQQALMRLSVFRGGFRRDAARAVAGARLSVLTSLVDKSLLRRDGDDHYSVHEAVRQFAGESLAGGNEDAATRRRHRDFYLALADATERTLFSPNDTPQLERLFQELDNLRAALDWTMQQPDSAEDTEAGLLLAAALWPTWFLRSAWQEGRAWLERLLALPHAARPTIGRARALRCAGEVANINGDLITAAVRSEEAVKLARRFDDADELGRALVAWARVVIQRGEHEQTQATLKEALALFEQTDNTWGRAEALEELGQFYVQRTTSVRTLPCRSRQDSSCHKW